MNIIPRNFFFDDDFDNLFMSNSKRNEMKCDIYEKDNNYHIEMDVPGYDKKDIKLEVKDGYLTVTAKKESNEKEEKKNYLRKERSYIESSRTIALGDVDADKIDASFNNGTLFITIPKAKAIENKKYIGIK